MNPNLNLQIILKKNLFLLLTLVVSTFGALIGIRFFLRAQEVKIPDGYSVLSYVTALQNADKNHDGFINALDTAFVIKRYGNNRLIADPQFGSSYNSIEVSFQIANYNKSISVITGNIFKNPILSRRYAEDIIVANELTIHAPNYTSDDNSYNEQFPSLKRGVVLPVEPIRRSANPVAQNLSTLKVLGETSESADTKAGGEATGSKGASSGRSIIPSVLGTVSSYTGSAGFDYPISVPAGPGGIAPSLSIGYSSGTVDDALPYNDGPEIIDCKQYDDFGRCTEFVRGYYYKMQKSYHPFYAGYGFSINGGGSIIRDDRGEKDVFILKGEPHHRFILNLPSGLSAELKFNKKTGRWASIPEGFVKIDRVGYDTDGKLMPGSDFRIFDSAQWVVTASDGSRYYFGEENLESKINIDGRIHGSEDLRISHKRNNEEQARDKLHHTITKNGGIYNEYDIADLCVGDSTSDPCRSRLRKDKPALLVTKWLLRRMETSDGRSVNYQYDSYQKYYGDFYKKDWNNKLAFATIDSYLRLITWNDDKHRVIFYREDRSDKGGNQFLSPQRLARVDVETKIQKDNTFQLVRRYQLSYANDDSLMEDGKNEWQSSLLKSIQEFGTDGVTKTPAVEFRYKQYSLNTGSSGSLIYLTSIDNGYGGETQYSYEMLEAGMMNGSGDGKSALRRSRVTEKRVVDQTSSPVRVTKETYQYGNAVGFADRIRGDKIYGREFLGHDWVDIKTYDFNSDKVLAHIRTNFYQFNGKKGDKTRKFNCKDGRCDKETLKDVWVCFEPHLNKGQPKEEIVYNQLPGGGEIEAKKTLGTYSYRILGWDSSGMGSIIEDNLNTDEKSCDGTGMTQPYFVYAKTSTTIAQEPESSEFVKTGVLENLEITPVNSRTVKQENLGYDIFGNLLKSVSYGPVNDKGEDLSASDNIYSYNYCLTGNINWLNNLPYLSYASNNDNCLPDKDNYECQYGRSEIWYDQFYGKFNEIDPETQKPTLGMLTQTKNYIETDSNHDNNHDDPVVTYQGVSYLRLSEDGRDQDNDPNNDTTDLRRGGSIATFTAKPGTKTVDNLDSQIIQTSTTEYDPYYKSLVLSTKNVLGHESLMEDYDYLLQVPRVSKVQTDKNGKYAKSRIEFDALGRMVASFAPDPADPSTTMSMPSVINTQFDSTTNPEQVSLLARTMMLSSLGKDGKYHYQTSDSFFDGLGKVKQTQILSKKVIGEPKRIVSDVITNAIGQQTETFEPQTADAVTLGEITSSDYLSAIKSQLPQFVSIDHRVLSRTAFDGLNRPITSTVIDVDGNREMTTRNYYYINASKVVNPKGVAVVTTTDSLGRSVDSLSIDPTGNDHTITLNQYDQPMINKPTKTTYKSIKELTGGSSASTDVRYDKSGRVLWSKEPSLGENEFNYDVLGNVIWSRRRAREDVELEYDNLGRTIAIKYITNSNEEELFKGIKPDSKEIKYVYDNGDNALGKLISVDYHMGIDSFTYDQAGRQKSVTKTIKDKTYSTTNHYNSLSQLTKVEYPDNHVYEMEYDDEGVVQKTYLNGDQLVASTIFDKFGRTTESQFVLGANTYLSRTPYDTMGRMTELGFAKKTKDGDGNETLTPYFYQKLQYDQFSQLTPLTESIFKDGVEDKTIYNYTYDTFSRLTKAESSKFNTSYSYDPFGRIQTKNENENITLSYDSTFPFFAPKAISRPTVISPSPAPTKKPRPTIIIDPIITFPVDQAPTEGLEPTLTPTITPSPTKKVSTPTPAGCFFEPIITIKERLSDGSLRTLSTEEAKDYFTINDKRKAKYDPGATKKEFWQTFTDGYYKACPEGGCDIKNKTLCCVDEKNELPDAYKIGADKANVEIKYFGSGSSKYEIVDKYCNNLEGSVGCPENTTDRGGLRDPDFTTSIVPHLSIGCNARYEYGWIVVKNTGIGAIIKKLFPAGRGLAQDEKLNGGNAGLFNFSYDYKGAMLEDDKQCYSYNRLNQLITLKIKKNQGQACNSGDFKKTINFYYDYAGTLVLQEVYKGNTNDLLKKTYYFGSYEDEYKNE